MRHLIDVICETNSIRSIEELADRAADHLRAKGWDVLRYYNSIVYTSGDDYFKLSVYVQDDDTSPVAICEYIHHDNMRADLTAFVDAVERALSFQDHLRGKWRQDLANLVTKGEELGFAIEYVEMLKATARALAENALPAPRIRLTTPTVDLDDEIPF